PSGVPAEQTAANGDRIPEPVRPRIHPRDERIDIPPRVFPPQPHPPTAPPLPRAKIGDPAARAGPPAPDRKAPQLRRDARRPIRATPPRQELSCRKGVAPPPSATKSADRQDARQIHNT